MHALSTSSKLRMLHLLSSCVATASTEARRRSFSNAAHTSTKLTKIALDFVAHTSHPVAHIAYAGGQTSLHRYLKRWLGLAGRRHTCAASALSSNTHTRRTLTHNIPTNLVMHVVFRSAGSRSTTIPRGHTKCCGGQASEASP